MYNVSVAFGIRVYGFFFKKGLNRLGDKLGEGFIYTGLSGDLPLGD